MKPIGQGLASNGVGGIASRLGFVLEGEERQYPEWIEQSGWACWQTEGRTSVGTAFKDPR